VTGVVLPLLSRL